MRHLKASGSQSVDYCKILARDNQNTNQTEGNRE